MDCDFDVRACVMGINPSATRAVYRMFSGIETPYKRVIKMENITPDEIAVESTVTWGSTLLGGTQTISLTTSVFNNYE